MTKLLCDVMRTLRTGLLVSLLVASYVMSDESAWKWCYHGKCGIQYWLCHYPDCGGLHQSPIDLSYKKADYDKSLVPVELLDWRWDGAVFVLENTGHSIQVDVRPLEGEGTYQFAGGALGATFQLAQFHLHFGDKDKHGSEHTLHGKSFPMEMHLVGYDTQYSGLKEAAVSPRGLAVIGIFFEVCDDDNEEFEKIVSQLDKVAKPGDRVRLDGFSLLKLLPQDCQRGGPADYYRYQGSLTTPPCYEHVQWTILRRTISISHRQMEKFRSGLYDSHGNDMADNFRPTQPLNDRVLLRSFRRSNGNAHGNGRKRW